MIAKNNPLLKEGILRPGNPARIGLLIVHYQAYTAMFGIIITAYRLSKL